MSFEERSKAAKEFQDKLFADLQAMGFNVALNGTEHTHPAFVSELHRSEDQTSMAIRYAPDGVACIGKIPRSFYVEAKFARTIERNAWIQYGKLVEAGNILVIVFGWENNTVFNFYENIKLIPGKYQACAIQQKAAIQLRMVGYIPENQNYGIIVNHLRQAERHIKK